MGYPIGRPLPPQADTSKFVEFVKVRQNLSKFVEFVKVCQFLKIRQDLSKFVKIRQVHQNSSIRLKICQSSSKSVKI